MEHNIQIAPYFSEWTYTLRVTKVHVYSFVFISTKEVTAAFIRLFPKLKKF